MSLSGEKIRKLLESKKNRRSRNDHQNEELTDQEYLSRPEDGSQDELDTGVHLQQKEYIDCYVVASKERLNGENWIKSYTPDVATVATANEAPSVDDRTTFTACMTCDLAFKRLPRGGLPPGVRPPKEECSFVYVVDKELTDATFKIVCSEIGSTAGDKMVSIKMRRSKERTLQENAAQLSQDMQRQQEQEPPPLPPKPAGAALHPPPGAALHPQMNSAVEPPTLKTRRTPMTAPPSGGKFFTEAPRMQLLSHPPLPPLPPLVIPPRKNRTRSKVEPTPAQLALLDAPPTPAQLALLDTPPTQAQQVLIDAPPKSSTQENNLQPPTASQNDLSLVVNVNTNIPDSLMYGSGKLKNNEEENHYESVESKSQENLASNTTQPQEKGSRVGGPTVDTLAEGSAASQLDDLVIPRESFESTQLDSSTVETPSQETPDSTMYDASDDVFRNPKHKKITGSLDNLNADDFKSRSRPMLPKPSGTVDDSYSSSSTDNYEAIDLPSRGSWGYLRPIQLHTEFNRNVSIIEALEKLDKRALFKDDIVIAERCPTCQQVAVLMSPSSSDEPGELSEFLNTTLVYDKNGCAYYVPSQMFKVYGDPNGEPWFYPIPITSKHATLFLRAEKQEGCFVLYKPSGKYSKATYNLSVCLRNGDVLHYHIMEGPHGNIMVEGHDHSFLNLADLVDYFRKNKSSLATRLRRPLKEVRLPITPGVHYDHCYELERNQLSAGKIIGKGNFGVVCAGVYNGVDVAIKVLQGSDLTQEDEDDFIEEASVLMRLDSVHIVKIIGVSCLAKPFFLVTEYVQHGNLKECLRNGKLTLQKMEVLVNICIQMVSAMAYLESLRYILHRDVATRNFLVADLNSIKLADFGRARFVNDDYYQAPRTEKISIKWAAPEVLTDFCYTTKSDVWATGVAIWEVFTGGERPYESLSAEQTAIYVTEGGRLQKPQLCPDELYVFMTRCWCHNPSKRVTSNELLQTIKSRQNEICQSRTLTVLEDTPGGSIESKLKSPAGNKNPQNDAIKRISVIGRAHSFKEAQSVILPTTPGTAVNNVSGVGGKDLHTSSSSDLSIAGSNWREDISNRGDKIRRSLRKLINHKSKTAKTKDLAGEKTKFNGVNNNSLLTTDL